MLELPKKLLNLATAKEVMITAAESCTGGMLSQLITAVPGSAKVFDRGFVTYSNEAKTGMLGVDPVLIEKFGPVSREVAVEMAVGALKYSKADIAISITGLAGPEGDDSDKEVGLVYFGVYYDGVVDTIERRFSGNRQEVREAATRFAMEELINRLST